MNKNEKDQLIREQHEIVLNRQSLLASTDYIAAKIAEGAATKTDYADRIAERKKWRADINAATTRIAELEATPVEEEGYETPAEQIGE